MTTAPSPPNTPGESPLSPDGKQRLGPHPLPSPAPPRVPPPPAAGSHWRQRAGLARRAGRGRARGGALQPAEPPARAGWGRSGSDSPPRPTRPWRTSGRTEPTVGAASGPLSPLWVGGPWGKGTSEIINTRAAAGGPLLLPGPAFRSAPSSRPPAPAGSSRVASPGSPRTPSG